MPPPEERTLPDLAALLAAVLQSVPSAHQPLLIALAERLAAKRYRRWAGDLAAAGHGEALRACAVREEEIAARIESLYDDAAALQSDLRIRNPELLAINQSLFADHPLHQQLAIQAQGERLGAATWRSLARQEPDPTRAQILESCAPLEEASAVVLEMILAERR